MVRAYADLRGQVGLAPCAHAPTTSTPLVALVQQVGYRSAGRPPQRARRLIRRLAPVARRSEVACRLAALCELVWIGEHRRTPEATIERCSVGRLPLALDKDAIVGIPPVLRTLR
jgi:hypothetical protein